MLEQLAADALEQREADEDVLLPGEYVELGDDYFVPAFAAIETAPPSAASPHSPVSDEMSVTEAPSELTAPAKRDERLNDEERARTLEQQAQEQRDAQAQAIGNRVQFGTPTTGEEPSDRKPGSVDGTTNADGTLAGKPGANLRGRTLASWSTPTADCAGTIVIAVRVDRHGKVTDAVYSHGSGSVASVRAARTSCINAAKNSSFSVSDDAPAEQTGTITYRFVPPHAPQ